MKKHLFAYLWWLALLPIISLALWLLGTDRAAFFSWWLAASLSGWLVWPLMLPLTPSGDHGYLLAKPLGLLMPALIVWLLSFLGIAPFQRWFILVTLLALGAVAWGMPVRRRHLLSFLSDSSHMPELALSEGLFAGLLLFGSYARGLKPQLDSLEKFMNIGFMNSLWRTTQLPALDMWFAGETINYYYFGQYFYTYLAKLTGIRPEIAYNLGMATTFALTAVLAYTAGNRLINLLTQNLPHRPGFWRFAAAGGLLSAILVTVSGNSHAFFFSSGSPGKLFARWLISRGWMGGSVEQSYWFANATRYIGYNPETTDKTIHEFPYYSFLVADLHAHVINLAFVLVFIILMTTLVIRGNLVQSASQCCREQFQAAKLDDQNWHSRLLHEAITRFKTNSTDPVLLLTGILLAVFMMANYWDFAIYLVVAALTLLIVNHKGCPGQARPSSILLLVVQGGLLAAVYLGISSPLVAWIGYAAVLAVNYYLTIIQGDAWTLTGSQISLLFFVSHTVALPFNRSFEPIAKSVARTVASTPLYQLLILWGPHLLAGLILATALVAVYRKKVIRTFPPPVEARDAQQSAGRFFNPFNTADKLVLCLFAYAVALVLIPEAVYVVDIYSGDYKRANTMFKFTYQAFVLFSLVWAYAIPRLFISLDKKKARGSRWLAILLAMLLLLPLWYTMPAAKQWLGSFSPERYQGLNGLSPLAVKDSAQIPGSSANELAADIAAIHWFNTEISGQPVILEAYGESYTDYCRISAMTGLPAVIGWETHEWLWRTSKNTPEAYSQRVLPRQTDIRTLYTTDDQKQRWALIEKYQIEFIIIGDLERARFTEDPESDLQQSAVREDLLHACGTVVFAQEDLSIIAVSR